MHPALTGLSACANTASCSPRGPDSAGIGTSTATTAFTNGGSVGSVPQMLDAFPTHQLPVKRRAVRQAVQGRNLVRRNIGDRLDNVHRNISDGGGGGGQTRRWAGDVDIRRWRCDRSDGHDAGPYERGASRNVRTLSFHVLAHPSTRCDDPTPHGTYLRTDRDVQVCGQFDDKRELCWPLPRQCSSSLKRCRCRSRNLPPLVSAGIHFSACRVARALQSVSAEPRVDSFSDGSPARLEHHVVTDVGEEFCFGAICACRCAYFFRGDRAVTVGP